MTFSVKKNKFLRILLIVLIVITILLSCPFIRHKLAVKADTTDATTTSYSTSTSSTQGFTIKENTNKKLLILGSGIFYPYNTPDYMKKEFPELPLTHEPSLSLDNIDTTITKTFKDSTDNDLNIILIDCHGNKEGDIFLDRSFSTTAPLLTFLESASKCKGHTLIITTACYAGLNIVSPSHEEVTSFLDENSNLTLITGSTKPNQSGDCCDIFTNIIKQTKLDSDYFLGDINKDGILTIKEAFFKGGFDAANQDGYIYPLNDTSEFCASTDIIKDRENDPTSHLAENFNIIRFIDKGAINSQIVKIATTLNNDNIQKIDDLVTFMFDKGNITFKINDWGEKVFEIQTSTNNLENALGLNWGQANQDSRIIKKDSISKFWNDLGIYDITFSNISTQYLD